MKYYVIDAFAEKVFEGNPAAVCVLDTWPAEELMLNIAIEHNLSETAFTVREADGSYLLRWFTPGGEVPLCGHATLATAFVLAKFYEPDSDTFRFNTMESGLLTVTKSGDMFELDFPAYDLKSVPVTSEMEEAIGFKVLEAYIARDLVCVLSDEGHVLEANPSEGALLKLDGLLLNITAKGSSYDCISRTFAPKVNIKEDPVCGSGHCHIVPIWAKKLGKDEIIARQASPRGGTLYCKMAGDRVKLSGKAVLYSIGEIYIY
ncbi:MAG: PhzF family phenazine biosynthesis protein [Defluviitaleaceae bacterium]|nr:PhzF family phenazine biosynthesis protein [Defluviitaleaceae bacterium]